MNLVIALFAALPLASFLIVGTPVAANPPPSAAATTQARRTSAQISVQPWLFEPAAMAVSGKPSAATPSLLAATIKPPLSPTAANNMPAGGGGGLRAGVCDDAIYSTGDADGVNALTSERGNFGIESFCADDAEVKSETMVGALHWQALVTEDYGDSTVDVLILPNDGGVPNGDDDAALHFVSDAVACRVDTGNVFWGYPVIQYSYYPRDGVTIPAGTTWFAARPVSGSGGGRAFRLTANYGAPQGYPAVWRSAFFGSPDWSNAASELGADTDFSMCIAGVFAGGSCCVAGDCSETTKLDCDKAGGEFNDAVPCCAVICRNRAAACCFADGTCENLKPAPCQAAGGIYLGEETRCGPGVCSLPAFCEAAIYSQFGYDGVNGFSNQDSLAIDWIDTTCADDAKLDGYYELTGIVIESVDRGNPVVEAVDYSIWATHPQGGPGKLIYTGDNISSFQRISDGTPIFGSTIWVYVVEIQPARVVSGRLWFNARPVINEFVQAFWLTAAGNGERGYFRSEFRNWEPAAEFSFCVLGTKAITPFGACCLDDELRCELLTSAECDAAGGSYYGDNMPCFPSPCRNAPGACCFLDPFGCDDTLSKAECESSGGEFQGGATECAQTYCPLPDFCENAIYSQFGYDGRNAFANQDSSRIDWVDSMCADDVIAEDFFEITSIVMQSIDRGDPVVGAIDYSIFAAHPQGGPGREIRVGDNVTTFQRIGNGTRLFGALVWTYVAKVEPTKVVPGQYWFNVRPVIDEFVQAFWLSAPGNGNVAYSRSKSFGVPSWRRIDAEGPYELSFCVTGAKTDSFGACCVGSESVCVSANEGECSDQGGVYYGDGSDCYPSPCANAPGACCFLDPYGCDDGTSKADCESRGGVFQGGDTLCAEMRCPLPDFCENAIYSQFGYDGINGWSNQDSSSLKWVNSECADDAELGTYYEITRIVIESMDRGDPTIDEIDYAVWASASGGGPGERVARGNNVTTFVRATDGTGIFGGVVWVYVAEIDPARVLPGQYWFNVRPVINERVQAFCLTASGNGNSAYFRGAIYGQPNWVKLEDYSGVPVEFSFCIGGSETAPFGACCVKAESICIPADESECAKAGGVYYGDDVSCHPSPCAVARGACCFDDPLSCKDGMIQDMCESIGGEFQGRDVVCEDVSCPLPDPCDGAYYSQYGLDGQSSYANMDGTEQFGYEYWVADDFSVTEPTDISGIAYQSYDTPLGGDPDGVEVFQYTIWRSTDAGPGDEVASGATTSFERAGGGEDRIYSNRIHFNVLIHLEPGDYYISARPVINSAFYSYFATAHGGGQRGYIRFNGNDWDKTPYDYSFCALGSDAFCRGVRHADSDGSGIVDFNDIDCFVAALISFEDWSDCGTLHSGEREYLCANDTDQNGSVDFSDIDSFIQCIIDGGCP